LTNVKKFMNKYIKILIVLIAIVASIGLIRYVLKTNFIKNEYEDTIGKGAANYKNEDIPSGFLFKSGDIPDSYLVDENYKNIYREGGSFSNDFYCAGSGQGAELIKYYKFSPGEGYEGGWSFRYVAVCEDKYLIIDAADSFGEKIYGPFDLNEPELDTPDISSPGVIETPGGAWNIYKNEKYGFSFEYPSDWILEEDSHGRPFVLLTSPERKIAAQDAEGDEIVVIDARIKTYSSFKDLPNNTEGLNFEDWLKVEDSYFDGEVTSTIVDGLDAYLIHSSGGYREVENEFIMLEYNGKIYELNFNVPSSNDYLEERDHMLQSFELIQN